MKERRNNYGTIQEMLKRKRNKKGGKGKRRWKETFSRSKKTPRLQIRKDKSRRGERQTEESGKEVERGTEIDVYGNERRDKRR